MDNTTVRAAGTPVRSLRDAAERARAQREGEQLLYERRKAQEAREATHAAIRNLVRQLVSPSGEEAGYQPEIIEDGDREDALVVDGYRLTATRSGYRWELRRVGSCPKCGLDTLSPVVGLADLAEDFAPEPSLHAETCATATKPHEFEADEEYGEFGLCVWCHSPMIDPRHSPSARAQGNVTPTPTLEDELVAAISGIIAREVQRWVP